MGCEVVYVVDDVQSACKSAFDLIGADDAVLITGSLYVAGAARQILLGPSR